MPSFILMIRVSLLVFFLLCLALLPAPSPGLAADETNPAGNTIAGDWDGTADNDTYTNQGSVTGDIDMSQGGTDTVVNQGTVD